MRAPIVLLLGAAGCAHSGGGGGATARQLEAEAQAGVAAVERVRGSRFQAPVRFESLEASRFTAAQEAAAREGDAGAAAQRAAQRDYMGIAFGLVRPDVDPGDPSGIGDPTVDGFYSRLRRAVLLRRDGAAVGGGRRALVAHQLTHALQHERQQEKPSAALPERQQPAAAPPDGVDATLAWRALLEGEATLVAIAEASERRGGAFRALLTRQVEKLKEGKIQELAQTGGAHRLVGRASRFLFVDGLAFVSEIFRAGGFALLDQVFAHPPTTTAQLLHPARYVAGDSPYEIAPPPAPDGMRVVAGGRLGEYLTGVLLSHCLPADLARLRAAGWSGDAYTLVDMSQGQLGLLWSTTWDSELDAYHFAFAIRSARCWQDLGGGVPRVADTLLVLQRGKSVALVRGLPADRLDALARPLLDLPRQRSPRRPPLTVPALVDRDGPDGVVTEGLYRSTRLNLSAPIPAGFAAVPNRATDLHIERGTRSFAAVTFVPLPPRSDPRLPDKAGEGWRIESAREVALGVGTGRDVRLAREVRSSRMHARVIHVGYCDGKATLLLLAVWAGDDDAATKLERWFEELHTTGAGPAPVCADL